jgi:hypothetical protein
MSATRISQRREHQGRTDGSAAWRDLSWVTVVDAHSAVAFTTLVTIVAVLAGEDPHCLFPQPLSASVLLSAPWLIIEAAISVESLALLHLVRLDRRRHSITVSNSVASLAVAHIVAHYLLTRSQLENVALHRLAIRPLAALIYATSCHEDTQGRRGAKVLTLGLCDPHNAAAWSEMVEEILRADVDLCRDLYPLVRLDAYQRARVGVVMHEAVLQWGEWQR